MLKKLISISLVATMVLVCASCGKKTDNSEYEALGIDYKEDPITITYLTIGDKPVNGQTEEVIEELNKILIRKVNAKLDVYYVGWDDYLNNYNQVLASEDGGIDLIGTSTDWLDAWANVVKGNFMPLPEETIRKYCSKTYSNISAGQWYKCSYKGDIYFIPENEFSQWTNHGIIYREDLAKEAGIGEIDSWSDVNKYLQYMALRHHELIPWDADGSNSHITIGYMMSMLEYAPIYELSTYGLWGAYRSDMSKIVSPYYEGNELIEFAKMMKRWDTLGVWRSDLGNAKDNTKEFTEGSVAMDEQHTQKFYTEIKPAMDLNQPDSNVKFFWFGTESGNLYKTSILHGAMAVHAKSKNPERALLVYDLIRNDPECYNLVRYGIKGKHYTITQEGMLEKPSGYNTDKDGFVLNFWWGRRDELEIPDSEFAWDDYYELVDVYERVATDYPWDGIPFITAYLGNEMTEVMKVCDKYIPEITYAEYTCTPEEEVALFRDELKAAGFEKVTEQLQNVLDSY